MTTKGDVCVDMHDVIAYTQPPGFDVNTAVTCGFLLHVYVNIRFCVHIITRAGIAHDVLWSPLRPLAHFTKGSALEPEFWHWHFRSFGARNLAFGTTIGQEFGIFTFQKFGIWH